MLKKLLSTLCGILVTISFTFAQTDNEEIDRARKAIATNNCSEATHSLDKVSSAGKMRPSYFLAMANAQDCLESREQAIYYYSKYLEHVPGNDSVIKRMAELKSAKPKPQASANEKRVANEQYQATTNKPKSKRKKLALDGGYMSYGIGYTAGMGGPLAPFRKGFDVCYGSAGLVLKKKAVLNILFNSGMMFDGNREWFRDAFLLHSIYKIDPVASMTADLTVGLFPVLFNKKAVAFAAGPLIAGRFYRLNSLIFEKFESSTLSVNFGVRANCYLGHRCILYSEYSLNSRRYAHAVINDMEINDVRVDLSIFRLGIALRHDSWF